MAHIDLLEIINPCLDAEDEHYQENMIERSATAKQDSVSKKQIQSLEGKIKELEIFNGEYD